MSTVISWIDEATNAVGYIRLDAVTSQAPEDVLTVTDHPVEQGANVTDHARAEPTRISIEGIVSTVPNPAIDTDVAFQMIDISVPRRVERGSQTIALNVPKPPITPSVGGLVRAGIGALLNSQIKGKFKAETAPGKATVGVQLLQQTAPRNRVRDVYEALLNLQASKVFVQLSTRDRDYFDLLIERVAQQRSPELGGSAQFQIDFKRVRVATSKTVQAPKPAEARGHKQVNMGAQAAKPDTAFVRRKTLEKAVFQALHNADDPGNANPFRDRE